MGGATLLRMSVAECMQLCETTPECVAIEYGVSYGGTDLNHIAGDCQLQNSADQSGCDGRDHNLDVYTMNVPVGNGGHRRAESTDDDEQAEARGRQALETALRGTGPDHRALQLAGLGRYDTQSCGFGDLSARAQEVDLSCCPNAGDSTGCQNFLPATCSYQCAAQFVPFCEAASSPLSLPRYV